MYRQFLLVTMCAAGCAPLETNLNPALQPFAAPIEAEIERDTVAHAIEAAQPEPYASLLSASFSDMRPSFDENLRALSIDRLENAQSRYPSFSPNARLGITGSASVGVDVRQVIFDGGVFEARYVTDDVEAVLRQIKLVRDLNDRADRDVEVYLSYRENLEKADQIDAMIAHLDGLQRLAEMRVANGISAESELSLFELELFEMKTDAAIARADASADLLNLESDVADIEAVQFAYFEERLPLSVIEGMAGLDLQRAQLTLTQREASPQIAVEGNGRFDPVTGTGRSGFDLVVDSDPVTFGGIATIERAEFELQSSARDLEMEISDAERETRTLKNRLTALEEQAGRARSLTSHARDRFARFSYDFEVGASSLTEAISLLETYRRSAQTEIDLKYQILNIQRSLAAQNGSFWNFDSAIASSG